MEGDPVPHTVNGVLFSIIETSILKCGLFTENLSKFIYWYEVFSEMHIDYAFQCSF
jgi:hypothetical protein